MMLVYRSFQPTLCICRYSLPLPRCSYARRCCCAWLVSDVSVVWMLQTFFVVSEEEIQLELLPECPASFSLLQSQCLFPEAAERYVFTRARFYWRGFCYLVLFFVRRYLVGALVGYRHVLVSFFYHFLRRVNLFSLFPTRGRMCTWWGPESHHDVGGRQNSVVRTIVLLLF